MFASSCKHPIIVKRCAKRLPMHAGSLFVFFAFYSREANISNVFLNYWH